jgi:hypothetical protein
MLAVRLRLLAITTGLVFVTACAAKVPPRPAGDAAPDPSAAQLFAEVTSACRGLRTLTATIALSGRAGDERLRVRLHGGFAAPQSLRLEGVAPFGPPIFLLAGQQDRVTLLFPREKRVLPDTPVAAVLERLTGLNLGADDLRLVLSGCLVEEPVASEGRSWPGGWKTVALGADRMAYLRQVRGAWALVAADYGRWRLDYADHLNGWPRTVRVRAAEESVVDLTARVQDLAVNVELPASAFVVDIPPDAQRISIDDLRHQVR